MTAPKKSRPTMLDVAERSGVSYQTVSRVINNHPYVSDEARQKVQEAIDALGYRPSKAATKLRSRLSKTIAIVLYGSWFNGPVQIALNVEMAARTSGFDVILTNVTETEQQVAEALQHVKDWSVDGVIMIVPAAGLNAEQIAAICEDIPVVYIDSRPALDVPSVVLDEQSGTKQIVEHLISLGHRQFFEISGPLNWYSSRMRHQACQETLRAHGIEQSLHVEGNWSTPGGYQAARRLLQQGNSFSAVVAANDSMALGVYRALHEAGLSVPQDVSVVGFDDVDWASHTFPPLTIFSKQLILRHP